MLISISPLFQLKIYFILSFNNFSFIVNQDKEKIPNAAHLLQTG